LVGWLVGWLVLPQKRLGPLHLLPEEQPSHSSALQSQVYLHTLGLYKEPNSVALTFLASGENSFGLCPWLLPMVFQ
jgi:hypothetical protein